VWIRFGCGIDSRKYGIKRPSLCRKSVPIEGRLHVINVAWYGRLHVITVVW